MRDFSGTIGQNLQKKDSKHPDIKGKCCIDGVEYNIGGWHKTGDSGEFYSLSFTKREKQLPNEDLRKPLFGSKPAAPEFHNDEVPF